MRRMTSTSGVRTLRSSGTENIEHPAHRTHTGATARTPPGVLGHDNGQRCLAPAARCMQSSSRTVDLPAVRPIAPERGIGVGVNRLGKLGDNSPAQVSTTIEQW